MITMKASIVLHQSPLRQWLQDLAPPSHRLRRWKCPGGIIRFRHDILTDALDMD